MPGPAESPSEALACDRALSLAQFQRRWPGLNPTDLPGLVLVERVVSEITKARPRTVAFVVQEALREAEGFALRHLAGVAEMRYALRARPQDWQTDASTVHLDATPDALWWSPEGVAAIEYDIRYDRNLVLRKARDYRRIYVRQYWGATRLSRVRYLQQLLGTEAHVRVLLAPWMGEG